MSTRTVRLDESEDALLGEAARETGLSVTGVIKRGIRLVHEEVRNRRPGSFWEIYHQLDLGAGGTSIAPSTEARRGVREALRRKHGR